MICKPSPLGSRWRARSLVLLNGGVRFSAGDRSEWQFSKALCETLVVGTLNRLNVEHRTSNIELRILMTLRFIYFKSMESC